MRMRNIVLIALMVLLAGCAATVQKQQVSENRLAVAPAAAKRMIMVVQGSKISTNSKDWEDLRTEWRTAMTDATAAAGLSFAYEEKIPTTPSDPAVLVVVMVKDYRYISQGARLLVGIMTGNAYMDAEVSFVELPANTPVGVRQYNTTSSAWHGIFAAMTPKQLRGISDEIVREVSQR